jgi:hypothetical protein
MPSKQHSNDEDLVLKDQYIVPPTRKAKTAPPKPWPLPDFETLKIDDWDFPGESNLPPHVDISSPLDIFGLFFADEWVKKFVKWTNVFAEYHLTPEAKQPKHAARPWQPTNKEEVYIYLAAVIHMGITPETCVGDYWGNIDNHGVEHVIKQYITLNRFEQLDRYFRITQPLELGGPEPHSTFDRIQDFSEHVRLLCRELFTPGIHLAVDESIQRFMGRLNKIVNIPSKPTPEGFKIWILANHGYILDWLWHARGDGKGPVDLDEAFTEEGFSKT